MSDWLISRVPIEQNTHNIKVYYLYWLRVPTYRLVFWYDNHTTKLYKYGTTEEVDIHTLDDILGITTPVTEDNVIRAMMGVVK